MLIRQMPWTFRSYATLQVQPYSSTKGIMLFALASPESKPTTSRSDHLSASKHESSSTTQRAARFKLPPHVMKYFHVTRPEISEFWHWWYAYPSLWNVWMTAISWALNLMLNAPKREKRSEKDKLSRTCQSPCHLISTCFLQRPTNYGVDLDASVAINPWSRNTWSSNIHNLQPKYPKRLSTSLPLESLSAFISLLDSWSTTPSRWADLTRTWLTRKSHAAWANYLQRLRTWEMGIAAKGFLAPFATPVLDPYVVSRACQAQL